MRKYKQSVLKRIREILARGPRLFFARWQPIYWKQISQIEGKESIHHLALDAGWKDLFYYNDNYKSLWWHINLLWWFRCHAIENLKRRLFALPIMITNHIRCQREWQQQHTDNMKALQETQALCKHNLQELRQSVEIALSRKGNNNG